MGEGPARQLAVAILCVLIALASVGIYALIQEAGGVACP